MSVKEHKKSDGKLPIVIQDGGKKKILEMSEISLWIDEYDDIFSDFDPRPYGQRALSDDFLQEAKRASRDKASGEIELIFLMEKRRRNASTEAMIKKRLKDHFTKHEEQLRHEKNKTVYEGVIFVFVGIILMFFATMILLGSYSKTFAMEFIIVLIQPAGWFLFWEGLNLAIFEWKHIEPDLKFYEKLSKSRFSFYNY